MKNKKAFENDTFFKYIYPIITSGISLILSLLIKKLL